ncbi:MAG: DUF3857 domain-containing protein [bacterium]
MTGCGGFGAIDLARLPGPADHPDAVAVVLLDAQHVVYRLDGDTPVADVTAHRRLRVLRPAGRAAATHVVQYNPGLWTLTAFEGRVIEPDGTERALGADDALDAPAYADFVLFADSRARRFAPAVPVGGVFEARSTVRHADVRLAGVSHAFAGRLPISESRLVVDLPPGWIPRWEARALGEVVDWAPVETPLPDGGRRLVWSRAAIEPWRVERLAPPINEMVPRVAVSLAGWRIGDRVVEGPRGPEDVSRALYALQSPARAVTPAVASRAAAIVAAVGDDPIARARALHAFVRDEVRYVAVHLGMGGWVPHPVDAVLASGHGDCKDQAALLGALLTAAGIESRQATIYAHEGWPRKYGLPTIAGNSNHQVVFADLPGGPVLLDPTRAGVAFGEVPPELQGAQALPLTAAGAGLVEVPLDRPDAHTLDVRGVLRAAADGALRGEVEATARGIRAQSIRRHLRDRTDEAEPDRALGVLLAITRARVAKIARYADGTPDAPEAVHITAEIRRPGQWREAHMPWALTATHVADGTPMRLEEGPRTQPVVRGVPGRVTHDITVKLPRDRVAGALPAPVALDGPFGRYRLAWSAVDGGLRLERSLERRVAVVPAAEVEALRRFDERVVAADRHPIVIRSLKEAP